jgi:hypothetical protein
VASNITLVCTYAASWGMILCNRSVIQAIICNPLVINLPNSLLYVELFELLFPKKYIIDVVLLQINDNIDDVTKVN